MQLLWRQILAGKQTLLALFPVFCSAAAATQSMSEQRPSQSVSPPYLTCKLGKLLLLSTEDEPSCNKLPILGLIPVQLFAKAHAQLSLYQGICIYRLEALGA